MEKYDFLLIYEVKNREFDSLCLLKYELDRRGYRTKISNTIMLKEKPVPVDAKVVVMPSLYGTNTVLLAKPFVKQLEKIVNLQWEQVFYQQIESQKNSNRYKVTGLARRGAHISWGANNYNRLVSDNHLPETHVKITGHMAHDFMRPEFSNFFIHRDELLKQYDIDPNARIILFISSFVYVNAAESRIRRELQEVQGMDNYLEFVEITRNSQTEILEWFKNYLDEYPDTYIIYRPHPAEHLSSAVELLATRKSNFRIIREYSVQQWIRTADLILNWFSTSLTEIIRAGKDSYMLRPYAIPAGFEYPIITNTEKYLKTMDDFKSISDSTDRSIQLCDTLIPEYYWYDSEKPTYKHICDYLETVLVSDNYLLNISWLDKAKIHISQLNKSIKISMHYRFSQFKHLIAKDLPDFNRKIKENQLSTAEQKQKLIELNRTSDIDIITRLTKFSEILENVN